MMLWQNRITSAAQNFKLGYNVQRPYPWRGTTPLICVFFVGLTILLVFVNIPLSAYDVVQEFTYYPNDTSPSLPFTNIIPASLRHTAGDFTPQTFKVGDTIQIDSSVFTYVIVEAFASGHQASSFPYYNNPLSSCDVLNISLSLQKEEPVWFSATVSCWIPPTYYKMTLNLSHATMQDLKAGRYPVTDFQVLYDLDGILMDLEYGWKSENVKLTSKNEGETAPTTTQNVTGIKLSVFPCCVCTDWFHESYIFEVQYNPLLFHHPPCDDDVAKFQATAIAVYYGQDGSFSHMNVTLGGNILPSDQELEVPSNVQLVLQNALQAIYSAIRFDLGVVPPNQIFASPIMFNKSISPVSLFKPWTNSTDPPLCDIGDGARDSLPDGSYRKTIYVVNDSYANCIRRVRSDFINTLQFHGPVRFRDRIPVPAMSYLRPVFRRKPLASAISSVFVATFAMVSAAWSLFHFIAGSFCQTQIDVSGCPHCGHCPGPTGDSESVLLSRRSSRYEAIAMGEMPEHEP